MQFNLNCLNFLLFTTTTRQHFLELRGQVDVVRLRRKDNKVESSAAINIVVTHNAPRVVRYA